MYDFEPLISLFGPVWESDVFFVLLTGVLPLGAVLEILDWIGGSVRRVMGIERGL